MNFSFSRIQHVGIPVTDISASEAFYKRLGFETVMQSSFDYNGDKGLAMMMKKEDIIMELYQMPEAELAAVKSRKAGNIDHIAFDVEDIETVFEDLKKEGFSVVEDTPIFLPFWKNGCRYFYISGPDGERLEFNQVL